MSFRAKKVIALIPARGGSKGVHRKNLRLIQGRPLVAHSLQAALDCTLIDQVVLSSDDAEILAVGRHLGVQLHQRSPAAASDSATANEVMHDFLAGLPRDVLAADPFVVFLQPTSPLRTGKDIDAAFALLESSQAELCISVVEVNKTPFKSFTLGATGCLQALFDESMTNANRQTLPKIFYPNGAIYIFPLHAFVNKGGFPSNGAIPYVMPESRSIDVDSEEDLQAIERLCPEK
ncbi:MAG: acylneuraminate cytidylyltransferase family protein [Pseudomonadota bacterium]